MPRCADCKHWDQKPDEYGGLVSLDVRRCYGIPMLWDATEWDDNGERKLLPEYSEQLAFAQDGSDYSASLRTRPDFFCAHFEQR